MFCDTLLNWFIHDRDITNRVSFFKGSLFIIVTSILLYFLINRLNDRIKQSATALRESEELLRFLVKDTLVIIDDNMQQRYVSQGAQRLFGYNVSELEGRALDAIIHPDDMQGVKDTWKVAVDSP